ncbi:MAG: MFS transporter [Gammaproteobacteria bacterium]|nr:MFS transporter [Gammaproteobacteria bacterium]
MKSIYCAIFAHIYEFSGLGVAYSSSTIISSISLLGIGIGIGVIIVNLMTELQLSSPEQDRAGIMGAAQAIGGSSLPIGMALSGLLLDGLHFQGISYETAMQGILLASAALSVFASITALSKYNTATKEYQT